MRTFRPSHDPFWRQMQQFQGDMNRLFGRWGDGGSGAGIEVFPAFNVWEEGEDLYVEAEVPGLDLKDLEIFVTGGNHLTIKGERRLSTNAKGLWHRQERAVGTFTRALTLPYPVDPDKVDARLENGVLLLKLTRHESARPRKIQVKA